MRRFILPLILAGLLSACAGQVRPEAEPALPVGKPDTALASGVSAGPSFDALLLPEVQPNGRWLLSVYLAPLWCGAGMLLG